MNRILFPSAFVIGLLALGWIAAGYLGTSPLALAMTLVITAFYLAGAAELRRYRLATAALHRSLGALPAGAAGFVTWLAALPASMQSPVRRRVEGEPVALPGPVMTPYLVGLLVLLGMLGTFLGMVATLRGTGLALETAVDVATIRASLAAPVKGLGLAFGTSVAGVAASAMLGLMSALARRERLQGAQRLDAAIATDLHPFTRAHQRETALTLLQRQADAIPLLVDRLHTLTEHLEQRQRETAERLEQQQRDTAQRLEQQQRDAAQRLEQQQRDGAQRLAEGQDRFHRETSAAYAALAESVSSSLRESLTAGASAAASAIQPLVASTLEGIARDTGHLHRGLSEQVERQLAGVSSRFDAATERVAATWQTALVEHARQGDAAAARLQAALDGFAASFGERSAAWLQRTGEAQAAHQTEVAAAVAALVRDVTAAQQQAAVTGAQQLDEAAAAFARRAESLTRDLAEQHEAMRTALLAQDASRLATWHAALDATAQALRAQWQQAADDARAQQQQICATLERTADAVGAQNEAHAKATIAEVTRLVDAAAQAPRAAAEVVAELRQKLSDSMVRDQAMLAERERLMHTLSTLLDAVNHASTEQRQAIDSLVATAASLLTQAGERFTAQVEAEGGRLEAAAAAVAAGGAEVASVGEVFGLAVERFGDTSERLATQLQRIEAALGQTLSRSDEQLAYYVAQAREIIDLSLSSQKQIVDDLQQLTRRPATPVGEAA